MRTLVVFAGPSSEVKYEIASEEWNVERALDDWSLEAMMFESPVYVAPEDRGDPVTVASRFRSWVMRQRRIRVRMVQVLRDDEGGKPDQTLMVRCRKGEGFLIGVKQEEH